MSVDIDVRGQHWRKHYDGFVSCFDQKQQPKVKTSFMMDLLLKNTQLFTSHDVNWWTGVVWVTCGLLWCFDSYSDGSHSLQRIQTCSDEETNSSTIKMSWGWEHFHFWVKYYFKYITARYKAAAKDVINRHLQIVQSFVFATPVADTSIAICPAF